VKDYHFFTNNSQSMCYLDCWERLDVRVSEGEWIVNHLHNVTARAGKTRKM